MKPKYQVKCCLRDAVASLVFCYWLFHASVAASQYLSTVVFAQCTIFSEFRKATGQVFSKSDRNHSSNSHLKIWNPWNFTMELNQLIPFCNISFRWTLKRLQVTFSEKGTKITHQTHIWKFEILETLLWNQFHSAIFPLDWHATFFWTKKIPNHCDFTGFV